MAVKQIQLRGISRTPSDRMTRDGGLAESLNMQLDGEELAPMRIPADVTEALLDGYPSISQGGKVVYIHNGNGYKNYIMEVQGIVEALIEGKAAPQTLAQNESLAAVQSLGNALVLRYESGSVEYFLFDTDHYVSFADGVTDLGWEFVVIAAQGAYKDSESFTPEDPGTTSLRQVWDFYDNTALWNSRLTTPESGMSAGAREQLALIREYQEHMWATFDVMREYNRERGFWSVPILARYAVRLYDGSYGFVSPPVLLGASRSDSTHKQVFWVTPPSSSSSHTFTGHIQYPYEAALRFSNAIPANWKDLVASVDIFVSEDIDYPLYGADIVDVSQSTIMFEGEQPVKKEQAEKAAFLAASNFYRIASLSLEEIASQQYYSLLTDKMAGRNDYRVTQPRLAETTRTGIIPDGLLAYNGRLLSLGDSYELRSGYRWMFGPAYTALSPSSYYKYTYRIRFYVKRDGVEYTVDALPGTTAIGSNSQSHGWGALFFPDPFCYKAEVLRADSSTPSYTPLYTIKMEEHPNLNCAYGYLGLGVNLIDLTAESITDFSGEGPSVVKEPRELSMTRTDSILSYELGNTQTFDEPIIGAATIAKALITSPYGLADIYVFTEGGIYTVGLMRDGSFGDIHPLARDVAIPGTITMIDHGIVFTTEKGVMLLQENGIQDISQVMHGRHDPLPQGVATLLEQDEELAGLVPAATDTTPFMAFMKGARAAYDYAGKRLLFFNDAFAYQYVFMLDTLTWHKTDMTDAEGYTILNSHPQCLVCCEGTDIIVHVVTTLRIDNVPNFDPEGGGEEDLEAVAGAIVDNTHIQMTQQQLYDDMASHGFPYDIQISQEDPADIAALEAALDALGDAVEYEVIAEPVPSVGTAIIDFSTELSDEDYIYDDQNAVQGLVVTRPLSFDAPDIRKVLKDIRIRTQANRADVKYILLASMDGKTWQRLTSRGGGSFKWFKIVLVTSLAPVERIGWLDVDVETRYTNKLR